MSYSKTRIAIVACSLAAALLLAPSESEGGLFDWLCPWSCCAPAPSATTYAPPYAVQRISLMPAVTASTTVCSPVAQTCYYAPQTTYRWQYSRMWVTSYWPLSALDPCTGCATTAYRPATRLTLLPWLHREPVTSYQLMCSNACMPSCPPVSSPCCPSPCLPGSTMGTVGTVIGSGCPTGCAPATTIPGPAPNGAGLDSGYAPPSTFKTERATDTNGISNQGSQEPDFRLKPTPDLNGNPASMEKLRLIEPYNKTAARPIEYATYRHLIERTPPARKASGSSLDVGGWRASRE